MTRRTKAFIGLGVAVAIIIAVAVAVPLALKKGSSKPSQQGGQNGGSGKTSGVTGSIVTLEDGTTFTYTNDFGGEWASDPTRPFAAGGKAQEWSPRVGAEEWIWGEHVARGVNLG
jgi:glucan 1,3-beta-glucosidase